MNDLDRRLKAEGFDRIGRIDAVGRRSLWMRVNDGTIVLRAGREGEDSTVTITDDNPIFCELYHVLTDARFAAEWEDPRGMALDVDAP